MISNLKLIKMKLLVQPYEVASCHQFSIYSPGLQVYISGKTLLPML